MSKTVQLFEAKGHLLALRDDGKIFVHDGKPRRWRPLRDQVPTARKKYMCDCGYESDEAPVGPDCQKDSCQVHINW